MESINGVFWTKNNPERKINGIVEITDKSTIFLSLNRELEKENIKYIYGLSDLEEKITLINTLLSSMILSGGDGLFRYKYEVKYLFKNQFVDLDYFTDAMRIEISGLYNLIQIRKWEESEKEVKNFENDFFGVNMSFVDLIEKENGKKEWKSYIVLKSKEKKDFFYWKDKLDEFYQYFSILLDTKIQIKSFKNDDISLVSSIIKDSFDRSFSREILKMLPEKNDVFIKNFTSKYQKFREVFQRHNYLISSSIISDLRLVLSISSLELIYNTLYNGKRLNNYRKDTFILNKKRIRRENICMWEKIEYLIEKYWEESLNDIFVSRENLESYLIDKSVTIRNNVIHPQINVSSKIEEYYKKREEGYFKDFVKIADCCFYFMKVVVLKELGVDIKDYVKKIRVGALIEYE